MDFKRGITDMPFEILNLIFENLDYLRYKVSLAQAHEKLAKAFAFHCRNKFRCLLLDTQLSLDLWDFVIRECGPTIEEFIYGRCGRAGSSLVLPTVAKHCPNLKSVRIVFHSLHRKSVPSFLESMKNSLTSIEISQEFSNPSTMLLVVSEMTQLKEFFFKGFVDENVNHLDKLIALEKLSIEDLKYVKPYHVDVLRICASLKNLRNLTLIRIKMLPYDGPYSTLWSSLKYLHVQHCTFSELPDCPNIEYLNIENPTCDIVGYALKFILRNGKNLTELYEDSYPPIDANSFLDMLRSCPKLRLLCSPMEYIKLYSGYLSSMVEILKENGVTPENPLELIVSRRIKWKWFRRLLRCTPDNELIDLYHTW